MAGVKECKLWIWCEGQRGGLEEDKETKVLEEVVSDVEVNKGGERGGNGGRNGGENWEMENLRNRGDNRHLQQAVEGK